MGSNGDMGGNIRRDSLVVRRRQAEVACAACYSGENKAGLESHRNNQHWRQTLKLPGVKGGEEDISSTSSFLLPNISHIFSLYFLKVFLDFILLCLCCYEASQVPLLTTYVVWFREPDYYEAPRNP